MGEIRPIRGLSWVMLTNQRKVKAETCRDTQVLTRSTPACWPLRLIAWQGCIDQSEARVPLMWPMRSRVQLTPIKSADIFIKEVMRLNFCNSLANTFPGAELSIRMFGGAMLPCAERWKMTETLSWREYGNVLTAKRSLLRTNAKNKLFNKLLDLRWNYVKLQGRLRF